MVTSIQTRMDLRGYLPDASVDPTDARKATVRCFGRSPTASGSARPWRRLAPRRRRTRASAWPSDGRTLASASVDRMVRLWDARTGEHRCTLAGHTARVTSLAF